MSLAAHERESNRRGKYVDKPLKKLGLEDKIKKYLYTLLEEKLRLFILEKNVNAF